MTSKTPKEIDHSVKHAQVDDEEGLCSMCSFSDVERMLTAENWELIQENLKAGNIPLPSSAETHP